MKAGRELDALVAEKVFGCKVRRAPEMYDYAYCECGDGEHGDQSNYERRFHDDPWDIRRYSTSIAEAWLVVEKLAQTEWDYSLEYKGKGRGYEFTAEGYFGKWVDGQFRYGHTVADTVPLHICLAALKIKEPV
jgi:hypothetical protein